MVARSRSASHLSESPVSVLAQAPHSSMVLSLTCQGYPGHLQGKLKQPVCWICFAKCSLDLSCVSADRGSKSMYSPASILYNHSANLTCSLPSFTRKRASGGRSVVLRNHARAECNAVGPWRITLRASQVGRHRLCVDNTPLAFASAWTCLSIPSVEVACCIRSSWRKGHS